MKKKTKIAKVCSLVDLELRARKDPNYERLAKLASSNLGGPNGTLAAAIDYLYMSCSADEGCSEAGVVDEVNFCIDLV